MCCSNHSLICVDGNSLQGCKVKLRVTVGLSHYMVYLGNELLGSEDETDCCFSKNKDKMTGRIFMVSGEVFRGLRKSRTIFLFPFWERRRPHE